MPGRDHGGDGGAGSLASPGHPQLYQGSLGQAGRPPQVTGWAAQGLDRTCRITKTPAHQQQEQPEAPRPVKAPLPQQPAPPWGEAGGWSWRALSEHPRAAWAGPLRSEPPASEMQADSTRLTVTLCAGTRPQQPGRGREGSTAGTGRSWRCLHGPEPVPYLRSTLCKGKTDGDHPALSA